MSERAVSQWSGPTAAVGTRPARSRAAPAADPAQRSEVKSLERILALPGFGQDEEALEAMRPYFPGLEAVRRQRHHSGESLRSYAERVADRLDTTQPFFLLGVSMGGFIALEMARLIRPRGVFLVSSGFSTGRLRLPVRAALWAGTIVPTDWLSPGAGTTRSVMRRIGGMRREHVELLERMLQRQAPRFSSWALGAMATWPGVRPGELECPVYPIHGTKDRFFAPPRSPQTRLIRGAGHFPHLTHPALLANLVAERLNATDAGPAAGEGLVREG